MNFHWLFGHDYVRRERLRKDPLRVEIYRRCVTCGAEDSDYWVEISEAQARRIALEQWAEDHVI